MRLDPREISVLVIDPVLLDGELLAMALMVQGYAARAVRDEGAALRELRDNRVLHVLIAAPLLAADPALPSRLQRIRPVEVLMLLDAERAVPAEALSGVVDVIEACGCYPEVAARFDAYVGPPASVMRVGRPRRACFG